MKALLFALFFTASISLSSQTTFWATTTNGGAYGFGALYRTDSIGNNMVVAHSFNSVDDGRNPGQIMQASNGKIYGMTSAGGHGVVYLATGSQGPIYTRGGTLYEYDPVIDSFQVLVHFNSTDTQYPLGFSAPSDIKLLEVSPGVLWGVFGMQTAYAGIPNRYVASYTIGSTSITAVAIVPSWNTTASPDTQYTGITGPLYKSNGKIYATTSGYSSCALNADGNVGSIITIDSSSHAFSYAYPFTCNIVDGYLPHDGNLENVNGDLYGYTYLGGTSVYYPNLGYGVIYKYNPTLNTYTKQHDFTTVASGHLPMGYLLRANNGKLYGTANGGPTFNGYPNGAGVLYEFDPSASTYSVKVNFNQNYNGGIGLFGMLWLKASVSGKLYGTTSFGVFEFNSGTGQARAAARFPNPNTNSTALIEICAKPAYTSRASTNYTICEGSFFAYDLECENAQSFVWKHNGSAAVSQTTSVLSFSAIAQADAGLWVCEMTNACGLTIGSSVTLTVNPSGSGIITSTLSASAGTLICPGSSITLSGNTGTWNTGAISSSISVSHPGHYQVVNTNTCGSTFSNIIKIDTLGAPAVQVITFTNSSSTPELYKYFCQGDSLQLTGNTNGSWNTGQTTASIFVKDTLPHYVISSNTCHTVYSATALGAYVQVPVAPVISSSGPLHVCAGDSVLLETNNTLSYNWYNYNSNINSFSYAGYGNKLSVTQSGDYYILINAYCGPVYSQTLHVEVSGIALDTAIITAVNALQFCPGDSITLVSNNATCLWSTGATSPSITVNQAGSYWVINSNSCSSATSAIANVTIITPPTVVYSQSQSTVCIGTPAFTLSAAYPPGGSYTGSGVSGNVFTPSVAGSGFKTVTYHYQDPLTGCTGTAVQTIFVDQAASIAAASSLTFCQGGTVVLYQLNNPLGTWNTGSNNTVLIVTQPGIYYVSRTDACGQTVSSNSLQVVVNAQPTLVVTGPPVCSGQSAVLAASGALTYTWSNGITNGAAFSPSATSVYTVMGTGSNGCRDTTFATLTVNPNPTISVNNGTVCEGVSFVLNPSGAITYTFSSGTSSVNPLITTNYTIQGSDANGCINSNTAIATVSVIAAPVLSVNSGSICNGSSFVLVPSGAATYSYSSGSATVTPSASTNYTISGTSAQGCAAAVNAVAAVTVYAAPIISVNSGSVCSGQAFVIIPSGASSYSISGGSATVAPVSSTSYTITGASAEGCLAASTAVSNVTVIALPIVSVNSGTICEGQTFTLLPSGASSYFYQGGSATVSPLTNTSYTVSGINVQGCLSASPAVASVSVFSRPIIQVNNPILCMGEAAELQASGGVSYVWSNGALTQTLSITAVVTTTYGVTGTGTNGCENTVILFLTVNECTGITKNALSENQSLVYPDPTQGEFTIEVSEASLAVINNSVGQLILQTELEPGKNLLNLNGQANGIYFVHITCNNLTKTIKLIKQ